MTLFKNPQLNTNFIKVKPILRQLAYDSLTPILAYNAIGGVGSTMMESAYDEGYGKFSFIGSQLYGQLDLILQLNTPMRLSK